MNDRLLTISIAAYNAEASLARTLASLECSEELFDLLDIIIVDDGSTDATADIAADFAGRHPGVVRIISQENGGYGSTVNVSIREARGLYHKLLDADDAFDTKGLEALLKYISGIADRRENDCTNLPDLIITPFTYEKSKCLYGKNIRVTGDGNESECGIHEAEFCSSEPADRHKDLQTIPVKFETAHLNEGLMMFELCVRTEMLRSADVRLTEHCYYTDNEYVMAAILYAESVVRLPSHVYRYSVGIAGQSMSIEGRRRHLNDKLQAARGVFSMHSDFLSGESLRNHTDGSDVSTEGQRNRIDNSDAKGEEQRDHRGDPDMKAIRIGGGRKIVSDILISTMMREVYVSAMIQEDPASYRHILREFDDEVANRWPDEYALTSGSKLVRTARKSGRGIYCLLCQRVLKHESLRDCGNAPAKGTDANDAVFEDTVPLSFEKLNIMMEYIVAACMIIQCRTVYMHLENAGMIVNRSVWVIMMAALAVCILCGEYSRTDIHVRNLKRTAERSDVYIKKTILIIAASMVYTAVFIAVNPVNYLRVIRCATVVLIMAILLCTDRGRECCTRILKCFSNLVIIIAAVSLLCWLCGSVFKFLPCTGYCYMDWSATGEYVRIPTFLGIYFETQWTGWSFVQARNSGIFVEAPMAGCVYSIAILIEYFGNSESGSAYPLNLTDMRGVMSPSSLSNNVFENRLHICRMALLIAAVLSTLSLISYAFLVTLAVADVLISITGSGRITPPESHRVLSSAIGTNAGYRMAVQIILILAAASGLLLLVANKLKLPSGNVRLNDFAVGFHAWLANPFFGGGFDSLEYLQQFMPEWRSFDIGFSNSPMEILAQGGIYLALPYSYAFAAPMIRSIRDRDLRSLLYMLLLAYIFTFNVIPYQYITFMLLVCSAAGFQWYKLYSAPRIM